jgi:adenylate kinase family enzyme
LLIGPTGAGKTPLGHLLDERGLHGRHCHHFDFGRQLRLAVRGDGVADVLSEADVEFLRCVLEEGALLEDEHFPIAERILTHFIENQGVQPSDYTVLNGLPRHVGQARDLRRLVDIRFVIRLKCSARVVRERIRRNTGGDRTHREDDTREDIRGRLELYRQRTLPLIEHLEDGGTPVLGLEVGPETTSEQMWRELEGENEGPAPKR